MGGGAEVPTSCGGGMATPSTPRDDIYYMVSLI